jgi:hypothetical protein
VILILDFRWASAQFSIILRWSCKKSNTGTKAQPSRSKSCVGTAKDFGVEFVGTAKPYPLYRRAKKLAKSFSVDQRIDSLTIDGS